MTWVVRIVRTSGDRKETEEKVYPSRAKAAATLKNYHSTRVERDNDRCVYTVNV